MHLCFTFCVLVGSHNVCLSVVQTSCRHQCSACSLSPPPLAFPIWPAHICVCKKVCQGLSLILDLLFMLWSTAMLKNDSFSQISLFPAKCCGLTAQFPAASCTRNKWGRDGCHGSALSSALCGSQRCLFKNIARRVLVAQMKVSVFCHYHPLKERLLTG